jgi:predicted Zn-dependent protease
MRTAEPARSPGILTREACVALAERIFRSVSAPYCHIGIASQVSADTRFGLGGVPMGTTAARALVDLQLRTAEGRASRMVTTRLDDAGLEALVCEAGAAAQERRTRVFSRPFEGPQEYPEPPRLFFDSVRKASAPEVRAALFRSAMHATEAAGLVAAGQLSFELVARAALSNSGLSAYTESSYGEFSLTARTKDGRGSGWSWSGFEDWDRVDVEGAITQAVTLALRSADAVAIEPGRYTVILQPAAVAALIEPILRQWNAQSADLGLTVFAGDEPGTNRIGLQMIDRRLSLVSDPWDVDKPTPVVDYTSGGLPIPERVVWFRNGVLQTLVYDQGYANLRGREPTMDPGGARLVADGPTTSLEDMIASTQRGVLVSRLSSIAVMNLRTLLLTGTTRDGTFLIENGEITKPIRNFRFTESPFFLFNRLEAWGEPVRASRLVVAPPLKVHDFDFTSLTDAI